MRPLADAKGIELEMTVPDHDVTVQTDRRSLSQILFNFTNNAIKFTERGQRPRRARGSREAAAR